MQIAPYPALRRWWSNNAASVDHDTVLKQLADDGRLTMRYMMMIGIAAGIATIGLLLNSPAVIIGAMLVSPLMGPIVLAGMALSTFDASIGRQAAVALVSGIVVALLAAGCLVLISPIADPTPEILDRTRPNLFDLVVALLSGLAGGYATVRGRGGAAVGVAIATALMPPLAVVAYGSVLAQWHIAKGASLLFVTNMLAIAAAVALVATWYGFARRQIRHKLAGQTIVAGLLLVPLCIPLLHSLQAIADETQFTRASREVLEKLAARENQSWIEVFRVSFPEAAPPRVEAVVLTREPIPDLQSHAQQQIVARSKRPVVVRVEQLRSAEPRWLTAGSAVANPVMSVPAPAPVEPRLADAIRAALPIPLALVDVDEAARRVSVLPKPDPAYPLSALHRMEQELATRHKGWQVRVLPPQ